MKVPICVETGFTFRTLRWNEVMSAASVKCQHRAKANMFDHVGRNLSKYVRHHKNVRSAIVPWNSDLANLTSAKLLGCGADSTENRCSTPHAAVICSHVNFSRRSSGKSS